jgi:hypothetical protein
MNIAIGMEVRVVAVEMKVEESVTVVGALAKLSNSLTMVP